MGGNGSKSKSSKIKVNENGTQKNRDNATYTLVWGLAINAQLAAPCSSFLNSDSNVLQRDQHLKADLEQHNCIII